MDEIKNRIIKVTISINNKVRFESKSLGFCKQFNITELKEVIMYLTNEYSDYNMLFKFVEGGEDNGKQN